MEKQQKPQIDLRYQDLSANDLKTGLQEIRALIVLMLGTIDTGKAAVSNIELSNALYLLQYLTEDVEYIEK